jgi:heme oxygenase (biliverdin-IX-beta and delta-forming)
MTTPPVRRDVLSSLRASTRAAHEAIERLVPLMSPVLTREVYREYLERALGFYAPIETAIREIPDWPVSLPDAWARDKVSLISADIHALGGLPTRAALCTDLPPLATVADAFGCMYVLEGSTLGACVIARHLKQHLDVGPTTAGAFVHSYGAELGPMWRAFGASLEGYVSRTGEDRAVLASAGATFAAFTRWLQASAGSPRWPESC